jgi:hypothetical protein
VANHPPHDDPHFRPCSRPHRLHRPLSTALRSPSSSSSPGEANPRRLW